MSSDGFHAPALVGELLAQARGLYRAGAKSLETAVALMDADVAPRLIANLRRLGFADVGRRRASGGMQRVYWLTAAGVAVVDREAFAT